MTTTLVAEDYIASYVDGQAAPYVTRHHIEESPEDLAAPTVAYHDSRHEPPTLGELLHSKIPAAR